MGLKRFTYLSITSIFIPSFRCEIIWHHVPETTEILSLFFPNTNRFLPQAMSPGKKVGRALASQSGGHSVIVSAPSIAHYAGWLTKTPRRGGYSLPARRWVAIRDAQLVYSKSPSALRERVYSLRDSSGSASVVHVNDSTFTVTFPPSSPREFITLTADTAAQAEEWVQQLRGCISAFAERAHRPHPYLIPRHATPSVTPVYEAYGDIVGAEWGDSGTVFSRGDTTVQRGFSSGVARQSQSVHVASAACPPKAGSRSSSSFMTDWLKAVDADGVWQHKAAFEQSAQEASAAQQLSPSPKGQRCQVT
jgi:hypothetical protein